MRRLAVIICSLLLASLANAQDASVLLPFVTAGEGVGIVYEPESNFTYAVDSGKARITGYSGPGGQLNIPPSLGGYPVYKIGVNSFWQNQTLTGLRLPPYLEVIDMQAFKDSSNLRGNLVIPEGTRKLGYFCFAGCVFGGTLSLPSTLTTLSESVFSGCSGFTGQLVLPASLSGALSAGAFSRCSGFTGSVSIPEGVTSIGSDCFRRMYGLNGTVTIADTVSSIGTYSFMESTAIQTMVLGTNVSSIGMWAFRQTSNGRGRIYFRGLTAPTLGYEVFSYYSFATAYVRPGATGYGDVPGKFGGVNTLLWLSYPDPTP